MKGFLGTLFSILLLLLLTSSQIFAQKGSATLTISSKVVEVGQPFMIEFKMEGSFKSYIIDESIFRAFEVVSGPIEFESYVGSIVGGSRSESKVASIRYQLSARQPGTYTFKPFTLIMSNGAQLQSNTETLKVLQGSGSHPAPAPDPSANTSNSLGADNIDNNVFIVAEVDKTNPYVGEQVNVTYKLYTVLKMSMRPISGPQLKGFWAFDEELPDNMEPHQENYNGRRYNVFILRRTALFPQQTGNLQIDPLSASGWVLVMEPNMWGAMREVRVNKTLESKPVPITVKPLPAYDGDASFSGGVGRFGVSASVEKSNFTTNDIIQLKVAVHGNGNLGLITAPELKLPEGLYSVPPETEDEITEIVPMLSGSRTFTYNISAEEEGNYTIPSLDFVYYDNSVHKYQLIKTQPINIYVAKGKVLAKSNASAADATMMDIITTMPVPQKKWESALGKWYYWAAWLLPALLFVSVKALRQTKGPGKPGRAAEQESVVQHLRRFNLQGLSPDEASSVLAKELWRYLCIHCNLNELTATKENIQQTLTAQGMPADLVAEAISELEALEIVVYAPIGSVDIAMHEQKVGAILQKMEQYYSRHA